MNADDVAVGTYIVVRPGSLVPIDGAVVSTESRISNETLLALGYWH